MLKIKTPVFSKEKQIHFVFNVTPDQTQEGKNQTEEEQKELFEKAINSILSKGMTKSNSVKIFAASHKGYEDLYLNSTALMLAFRKLQNNKDVVIQQQFDQFKQDTLWGLYKEAHNEDYLMMYLFDWIKENHYFE